jgi:hypothetical protein
MKELTALIVKNISIVCMTQVMYSNELLTLFSVRGSGKNWWKLELEAEIPNELRVVNDYGNHWLWEPSYSMPLDEYQWVLESVGKQFYKVS